MFAQMRWQDAVDIALVSYIIYKVILMLKGTRAVHMLMGMGVVFVLLLVSQHLNLLTINWIINTFLSSLILVVIILVSGGDTKSPGPHRAKGLSGGGHR